MSSASEVASIIPARERKYPYYITHSYSRRHGNQLAGPPRKCKRRELHGSHNNLKYDLMTTAGGTTTSPDPSPKTAPDSPCSLGAPFYIGFKWEYYAPSGPWLRPGPLREAATHKREDLANICCLMGERRAGDEWRLSERRIFLRDERSDGISLSTWRQAFIKPICLHFTELSLYPALPLFHFKI